MWRAYALSQEWCGVHGANTHAVRIPTHKLPTLVGAAAEVLPFCLQPGHHRPAAAPHPDSTPAVAIRGGGVVTLHRLPYGLRGEGRIRTCVNYISHLWATSPCGVLGAIHALRSSFRP